MSCTDRWINHFNSLQNYNVSNMHVCTFVAVVWTLCEPAYDVLCGFKYTCTEELAVYCDIFTGITVEYLRGQNIHVYPCRRGS